MDGPESEVFGKLAACIGELIDAKVAAALAAQGPVAPGPRELRIEAGLELGDLADKAGVSRSWLSGVERGKYADPSIERMNRIADALGIDRRAYRRAVLAKARTAEAGEHGEA